MGQAFLYGNGSGSGTGGILTVTASAGDTVTISKDGKTKTKTADSSGQAVFKGLKAGAWTVTITNGSQTATKTVNVVTDYAVTMTYFSATIAVTWPEGSSCTCSDGSTTLTAPTTSGSYTFTVPNAGTWTVSCTDGTDSDSETVTITTDGESKSVELMYWDGELFDADGKYLSATGGWSKAFGSPTLTIGAGTMRFTTTTEESGIAPNKPIDFTGYKTLRLHGTDEDSGGYTYIYVAPKRNTNEDSVVSLNKYGIYGNVDIDVKSISGEYYVIIQNESGFDCDVTLDNIKLIK